MEVCAYLLEMNDAIILLLFSTRGLYEYGVNTNNLPEKEKTQAKQQTKEKENLMEING